VFLVDFVIYSILYIQKLQFGQREFVYLKSLINRLQYLCNLGRHVYCATRLVLRKTSILVHFCSYLHNQYENVLYFYTPKEKNCVLLVFLRNFANTISVEAVHYQKLSYFDIYAF